MSNNVYIPAPTQYGGVNRLAHFGWGLVLLIGALTGYTVAFGASLPRSPADYNFGSLLRRDHGRSLPATYLGSDEALSFSPQ